MTFSQPEETTCSMTDTLTYLAELLNDDLRAAFCTRPILTSDDIDFPESLRGESAHLGFALLELLNHAGLDDLNLTLEAWTLDPAGFVPDQQPYEPIDASSRLAYGGTDEGRTLVIYDPEQFDDLDNVLGSASLLVAEIYRDLVGPQPEVEAHGHTVDDEFVAICLGFGPLLANASLHIEHGGSSLPDASGLAASYMRMQKLGELGPFRLGELLAAQLEARGADDTERRRIRDALALDPRQGFDEARESLDPSDLDVLDLPAAPPPHEPGPDNADMTRVEVARNSAEHRRDL
jgi:hypothetical protein